MLARWPGASGHRSDAPHLSHREEATLGIFIKNHWILNIHGPVVHLASAPMATSGSNDRLQQAANMWWSGGRPDRPMLAQDGRDQSRSRSRSYRTRLGAPLYRAVLEETSNN
jgi:hypothetical protein